MDTNWLPDLTQSKGPKYRVLANALEDAIRDGRLETGTKLPPVRDLAWTLQITPGTVARAYQIGIDDGVLEAAVGRGTFVRSREKAVPEVPANPIATPVMEGCINLRTASTPDVGQDPLIKDLTADVLKAHDLSLIDYVRLDSDLEVRQTVLGWLSQNGIRGDVHDLTLTYGAQQATLAALHATVNRSNAVVLSDELVYPGFRQAARMTNAQLYGVEGDNEGIIPDALDAACRRYHPQAILVSPNAHNPTTATMSEERRAAIALIARRHDIQIIEDDVYGFSHIHNNPSLAHFCPERVWHASSLSKCGASGLRVGWLLAPQGKGNSVRNIMQSMTYSISALLARITQEIIASGLADELRIKVQAENARRVKAAVNVLGRWNVRWHTGAPFLWLDLPEGWRSSEFALACEQNNVLVAASDVFTTHSANAPNAVRLSLGANHDLQNFQGAVRIVDRLLTRPARELVI